MRPVNQTIVDRELSDCLRACVASLLEVPIEVVPNFHQESVASKKGDGFTMANRWLKTMGLGLLQVDWKSGNVNWSDLSNIFCIFTVPSQRFPESLHNVIGKGYRIGEYVNRWEVAHDPNPANKPYKVDEVLRAAFIVQLC